MDLRNKWALVTGASSGIGTHFARQLAARGMNVVITARREARLETLASELREGHGVEVRVIASDLSAPGAATALFEKTEGERVEVDVVINNAGFGTQGDFLDIPLEKTTQQMQLNLRSLTELTWRFGRAMRQRRRGWILNVASVGAYMPIAGYAAYAAGKAYVRNFTEAVAHELRDSPVTVCCLCPGATKTEFMEVAGHPLAGWQQKLLMSAERCAAIGLRALFGGRRNIIAGFSNAFMMFTMRFVPRRMAVWIASKVMAPAAP